MRKLIIIFSFILVIGLLTGCGWREDLKAPPDEMEIPDGSLVATCFKDDDIYEFIYKDDGVYQYFINNVEQDEDAVDSIIEQAYLHGSSVENYLVAEFPDACTVMAYRTDEE